LWYTDGMAKKIIVANWKMNPASLKEAESIIKGVHTISKNIKHSEIVICPPFPFLQSLKKVTSKKIHPGAQNMCHEIEGAYTGEVSALMIRSLGVRIVILGHSERRMLGDTNTLVQKKMNLALKSKLSPILCIGEQSRDHTGFYLGFIKDQLHECLQGITKANVKNITIAYEPVWAIGKGATREATVEEFIEMRIFIRRVLSDMYDAKTAHAIPILYGGSVHPENARAFLVGGEADGLLVGRDSLTPKKFNAIVQSIE
jgi:triosephosphate isomerase